MPFLYEKTSESELYNMAYKTGVEDSLSALLFWLQEGFSETIKKPELKAMLLKMRQKNESVYREQ